MTWLRRLTPTICAFHLGFGLGDGDAIGLTLTYLKDRKVLDRGPAHVHVLDFDERIVNSVLSPNPPMDTD